jgi:hypothetical protein
MHGGIWLMSMGVVRPVMRRFAVCTDQYLGTNINYMSETAVNTIVSHVSCKITSNVLDPSFTPRELLLELCFIELSELLKHCAIVCSIITSNMAQLYIMIRQSQAECEDVMPYARYQHDLEL